MRDAPAITRDARSIVRDALGIIIDAAGISDDGRTITDDPGGMTRDTRSFSIDRAGIMSDARGITPDTRNMTRDPRLSERRQLSRFFPRHEAWRRCSPSYSGIATQNSEVPIMTGTLPATLMFLPETWGKRRIGFQG